jgi:hypothetical protein
MARVINCEDGIVVRGETQEELLVNARRHIEEYHPELVGQLTDEQLLAMSEEV